MSRNQIACCPGCGGRIPFKKFVQLNNFSVTNCGTCNARIEISNRTANAIIAAVSGVVSAASIVVGAYIGQKDYQSLVGGLFGGLSVATIIIVALCMYAYRHSQLNRIHLE
jgi:Na+-driven multidrug efflux pump